jgi:oligopeptide/dipeptide ABC transporter ATP-binding protein
MVMYAGFIIEEAPVDNIYEEPMHPYTLSLLAALPRVDERRHTRLKSIPGAPPNLLVKPHGCPFEPRCEFAFERCQVEMPPLELVATKHKIACWIDVTTGKPR